MKLQLFPLLVLFTALISACSAPSPQSDRVTVLDRSQHAGMVITQRGPSLTAEQQRIQRLLVLLDQADQAMQKKRLTSPEGENAYGYYQQALRLAPGNKEARQGLAQIVDRYLQWADQAQRQGRLDNARHYLSRAAMVNADDARIAAARKRLASATQPVGADKQNYYQLDVKQLRKHTKDLQQQLAQIADQIYARNSRVMIEAPSDQQGRWLYQQLNNRHEEYRVRANLRIVSQPGIRLLN